MSKSSKYALLIIIIAIPFLLFATGILKLPKSSIQIPNQTNQMDNTTTDTQSSSSQGTMFPVAPNNQSVNFLRANYSLSVTVEGVNTNTEPSTLSVTLKDGSQLALPIEKTTDIFVFRGGTTKETVPLTSLKKDTALNVTAEYNSSTKKWTVFSIVVLQAPSQAPTTPATQ